MGKLAVVTGGGSGMGRELVRRLAAQEWAVAACDRNAVAVADTAANRRARLIADGSCCSAGILRRRCSTAYGPLW